MGKCNCILGERSFTTLGDTRLTYVQFSVHGVESCEFETHVDHVFLVVLVSHLSQNAEAPLKLLLRLSWVAVRIVEAVRLSEGAWA